MSSSPLLANLIEALRCLPGVGGKSAQRMAFHLLERDRERGLKLADALREAMQRIGHCGRCRNFSEEPLCTICAGSSRDRQLLCVVESPVDLAAIEQATGYRGQYFVLHGRLSPLDGLGPEELGLPQLAQRLGEGEVEELIIATNPIPFRNARQMRIEQPIVSAIGSSSYQYVNGMGEFGHDIVFPEFVIGEDPLPHQVEFVNLYKKTFNALPKNYEAAGFDAVNALARALEKAGPDAAPEAIAKALREPYKGVLATYNFGAQDMTGIELSSYVYSKLMNGKFTRLPFKAQ